MKRKTARRFAKKPSVPEHSVSEESDGGGDLTCQTRPDAHHLVEDLRGGHGGLHED